MTRGLAEPLVLRERLDENQVTTPPQLETPPPLKLQLWEMDDFGNTEVLTSKKSARRVKKKVSTRSNVAHTFI